MPLFSFIFESIGTSELILIGIIALIFLGPRKLPQIARTLGKTMADFRITTNEFKSTWQKEVNFEEEEKALRTGELTEQAIAPEVTPGENAEIAAPSIKTMDKESFDSVVSNRDEFSGETADSPEDETSEIDSLSDKRNWL